MLRRPPAMIEDEVVPYLSNEPQSARELCNKIGWWSKSAVKRALDRLVQDGRARRSNGPTTFGPAIHLYARTWRTNAPT